LKKTGPPAIELTDVEAAKKFSEKDEVVLIAFFEDLESKGALAFKAVADIQDSLAFGTTSSKEVAEALGCSLDSIVLFKQFDDGKVVYEGEYIAEDIESFIIMEQLPLVTIFSDDTAPKIFGGSIRSHLLAFFANDDENAEATLEELRTAAKQFKGKILFVQIDTAEEASERIMEFFNIKDGDTPTSRLINLEDDMRKYIPDFNDLTAEKLVPFVEAYLAGDLKPHLNTEDIPEDWDSSPVKILVGKNFEEVVRDPTKTVFIEFYAPWCGHCKQLAPIWDELAEHFASDDDVVIAKMDATKNEVDGVQVTGFPTLKLCMKETNEMIDYTGGRTLEDLIEFLEAQVAGEGEEEEEGEGEEEEEQEEDAAKKDEL
jgi:protein disulfide-isomerase A1